MLKRASHSRPEKLFFPALVVLLAVGIASGEDPPILRGEWAATVGTSKTLSGRWIGQALPGEPNVMQGSWTLRDEWGRTILAGTWTARKKGGAWEGSWSASDKQGRTAFGAWIADNLHDPEKSLEGLIIQTSRKRVSGSWRSGGQQGSWWLKGSAPPALSR
jgi:hypothetical protein